jgi:Flp pilus assembly protein TadD
LQLAPDDAAIRNDFGAALSALGRLAEARLQFEAALRIKPDFEIARRNLQRLPAP